MVSPRAKVLAAEWHLIFWLDFLNIKILSNWTIYQYFKGH